MWILWFYIFLNHVVDIWMQIAHFCKVPEAHRDEQGMFLLQSFIGRIFMKNGYQCWRQNKYLVDGEHFSEEGTFYLRLIRN